MKREGMPQVRVHILTDGAPVFSVGDDGTFTVENALIGKDFHWHSRRRLRFEGVPEMEGDRLMCSVGIEDYLRSVIASEMNPDAPAEFLKAHAVISRSWVLGKVLRTHSDASSEGRERSRQRVIDWCDTSDHEGFDICNDDHCQRYQGLPSDEERAEAARQAVEATAGLILTDSDGNPADARFSKCCGGATELFSTCWQDKDLHYLQSFQDPFCDLSDMAPEQRKRFLASVLNDYDLGIDFHRWEADVPVAFVEKRLKTLVPEAGGLEDLIDCVAEKVSESGRIYEMRFLFSNGEITVGKELIIRRIFSETHLYSSAFGIRREGDSFLLSGRGWGHGVGLCQIGAARMALEGAGYEQILRFYYPTAILKQQY